MRNSKNKIFSGKRGQGIELKPKQDLSQVKSHLLQNNLLVGACG